MTARDPRPLSVGGAWPQRGGNAARTGTTTATGTSETGTAYWHLRRVRSGPAVLEEGRLFHVGTVGERTASQPTTTRTREESAGTAHPVYGTPALFARQATDGRIEWTRHLPSGGGRWPAVADGTVYASGDGWLAAFDTRGGTMRWTRDHGDGAVGDPTVTEDTVVVPLQGVVEGGSGEYRVTPAIVVYDHEGAVRWRTEPPKRANSVAVADDTVYVVSGDYDETGVVVAYGLADGTERWRMDVPGAFFVGPVVAGERVLVGAGDTLRAFATADGHERWAQSVPGIEGVAGDSDAIVAAGDDVRAFGIDGSEHWQVGVPDDGGGRGSGNYATPAIGAETVYAGTNGFPGQIRALAREDGTERWHASFPETVVEGDQVTAGVMAQPTVAQGSLFVSAEDGLYAFGPA
jgi:outer membrane protein assembly factor BamB